MFGFVGVTNVGRDRMESKEGTVCQNRRVPREVNMVRFSFDDCDFPACLW